jgi:hypothetical protein
MLKRLGSRQSNLTDLKDAEEGPSVLLIEPAWYVEAVKPSSLRHVTTTCRKACDDDLPKSVDILEQHFADLTGRQTYFHMDERAAGSPQIATSRPISTTASRGSLKYSLTWTELRCIAANSASTHRGRRLPHAKRTSARQMRSRPAIWCNRASNKRKESIARSASGLHTGTANGIRSFCRGSPCNLRHALLAERIARSGWRVGRGTAKASYARSRSGLGRSALAHRTGPVKSQSCPLVLRGRPIWAGVSLFCGNRRRNGKAARQR